VSRARRDDARQQAAVRQICAAWWHLIIVSEPFAVAYGIEALLHTMIIDVGAGTTDFCVMKGATATEEDQRTRPSGDSVDTTARQVIDEPTGVHSPIHMVRGWKEQYGFVGEPAKPRWSRALCTARREVDITDAVRAACESLLAPSRDMLDSRRGRAEYQEKVRQNRHALGAGLAHHGLAKSSRRRSFDLGCARCAW